MGTPNILLVTVDCLRRDRLSGYGYDRPTTPFLDRLLPTALHCWSAHSVSSWTCPSVISLLSGVYPYRHGGGLVPGDPKNLSKANLPTVVPADVPLLPDLLAAEGYSCAAIGAVWNAHLSLPGRFPQMQMVERPARTLVRRALRWIERRREPFFLWLHLGDPHEPLDVPRRLRHAFGRVPRVPKARRWAYTKADDPVGTPAFERYREARVRLYDAAVRSVDQELARLWDELGSRGLAQDTLTVITSDHGEEFWEHRDEEMRGFSDPRNIYGTGHGHNLFQVHLLIPLLMIGPGVPPGRIDANVSQVDVVPTVLEAAGIPAPPVDGRSLLGPIDPDRPILSHGIAYGHEKTSVVVGDAKLLRSVGDRYEHTFRLGPDRREDGSIEDADQTDRLRSHLPAGPVVVGQQLESTDEIERHLRGLGYIE
ncbi:MAG: sulfatase [Actinomycetota bacterium]